MDAVSTIISLISGLVGGNIAGPLMAAKNLGPVVNSISGLVGGGIGQFILRALGLVTAATAGGGGGSELDLAHLLSNIGVSGVSGGVLTAIVAAIKGAVQQK